MGAARELVAKHGYEGTIMRDVATLANVSPTTLYNLYNTKDELLLEALQERMADGWGGTTEAAPEPGFERLLAQIHRSVDQTREEPAYAKAITQALLRANEGDPLVDVLISRTTQALKASLEAMQKQRQLIPAASVEDLARALVSAFWANYMQWSKGLISIDVLHTELKRGYLSYLLPATQGEVKKDIQSQLEKIVTG